MPINLSDLQRALPPPPPSADRLTRLRAARSRTCAEVSASPLPVSFSYSTRGASTWMSIRSSSRPLMRFW